MTDRRPTVASDFRLRMPRLVVSLCDHSGSWSQPYEDAGYDVRRVDIDTNGIDVRLMELPRQAVHGVLAAPPCTVFASSGARWPRTDDEMREGLSVVDACCRFILAARPEWWCLENPHGKLSSYLGPPRMTFQPNEYGDDYTKLTCLWGVFNTPTKTPAPALAGSKMHLLPPSADRARLRSVTPAGFARAFYEANP